MAKILGTKKNSFIPSISGKDDNNKSEGVRTKTVHKLFFQDARDLSYIDPGSVDLIVTSPPYPMIEMWDNAFAIMNPDVKIALDKHNGNLAFEQMHQELDRTWKESYRVLKDGGFMCVNIGDATRTLNGNFRLFPNHSRILEGCFKIGFQCLPEILWRKQTNAPNKFMGSGMLPAGAYVTLEHEYILILRKGEKRIFDEADQKALRMESSFFWEERNIWFSDIWMDIKGVGQRAHKSEINRRSGAYPISIPYRLISMYSAKGDVVLDPFLGTGTTTIAAMISERNSIGIEIDKTFRKIISSKINTAETVSREIVIDRLNKHLSFIAQKANQRKRGAFKHENEWYKFPVVTKQETKIFFRSVAEIKEKTQDLFEVLYGAPHAPLL